MVRFINPPVIVALCFYFIGRQATKADPSEQRIQYLCVRPSGGDVDDVCCHAKGAEHSRPHRAEPAVRLGDIVGRERIFGWQRQVEQQQRIAQHDAPAAAPAVNRDTGGGTGRQVNLVQPLRGAEQLEEIGRGIGRDART